MQALDRLPIESAQWPRATPRRKPGLSAAPTPPAPDFTLPASGGEPPGKPFTLSDFRPHPVVLYFYPKDSTPGCTTEAQDFRDLHADFAKLRCVVAGVSRDGLKSHDNFRTKQGLPFALLSDTDETVCALYGVMKMKKLYGKDVRGIERSTFLIDRNGRIAREWRGVKVAGHVAEVLDAVRALP
jgi:peroxiredoxin Q/BCP